MMTSDAPFRIKLIENIVGKEENAGNQVFLPLSLNVFYPIKDRVIILAPLDLLPAKCYEFG